MRLGARPVFVDIDAETFNLNVDQVSARITSRTKVIMPVHLFGRCAELETLRETAARRGILIIEDAVQAIGARDLGGKLAGTLGEMACFSFFPSKNLGAFGDASMVVTSDAELAESLRVLRVHGGKPKYYHRVGGGNLLLYSLWPWLREIPFKGDSSKTPVMTNILSNETFLGSFFDEIYRKEKILMLGCSESNGSYNIGAQLNALGLDNPQMAVLAWGWVVTHTQHVSDSRAQREGLRIPPIVLVVNPVYFTRSHDVINDGWMSTVIPSPIFMQMNHRRLREYLTEEVRESYDTHFDYRRALYPSTIQEYLGNLIYLAFHQPASEGTKPFALPISRYYFNGPLPKYDDQKNVWLNMEAVDRFEKTRWRVSEITQSVNLKGLASSIRNLAEEPAPVLLLVLPVNRRFYEYHQLDMEEFDSRYRDIRKAIYAMARGDNVHLIDLFDMPGLQFGFRDRMHMDEYGFHQLANHVYQSEAYNSYLEAVRWYYGGASSRSQTDVSNRVATLQ